LQSSGNMLLYLASSPVNMISEADVQAVSKHLREITFEVERLHLFFAITSIAYLQTHQVSMMSLQCNHLLLCLNFNMHIHSNYGNV